MKRLLILIALALPLAACNEEIPAEFKTQYVAIVPPNTLYECPKKPAVPDPETLTDQRVAEYVVRLSNGYDICSRSLKAIKAFADGAALAVKRNQPSTR